MTVDRTRLTSRMFDRRRARLGLGDDLEIIKSNLATGYETAATISSGWFGQKVSDNAIGEEFFEVRIADDSALDLAELFRDKVSHLKVGEYYYKFSGVEQPRQVAVRVWLVRCSPTGERRPA